MAALLTSLGISIHAPREGGDYAVIRPPKTQSISIHAPREGGDFAILAASRHAGDFNPRPPRGGRRECLKFVR